MHLSKPKSPGMEQEEGDVSMTMRSGVSSFLLGLYSSCNFFRLVLSGSLCLPLVQLLSCCAELCSGQGTSNTSCAGEVGEKMCVIDCWGVVPGLSVDEGGCC